MEDFVEVEYLALLPLNVVDCAKRVRSPWTLVPPTCVASATVTAPMILGINTPEWQNLWFPFLAVSVFYRLQIGVL